jgi:hypothetical protein
MQPVTAARRFFDSSWANRWGGGGGGHHVGTASTPFASHLPSSTLGFQITGNLLKIGTDGQKVAIKDSHSDREKLLEYFVNR